MNHTQQIKVKVSYLLQHFVQGQIDPSMESLRMYQITQEQFREGLLLLKVDANGQKQQREAQILTRLKIVSVAVSSQRQTCIVRHQQPIQLI